MPGTPSQIMSQSVVANSLEAPSPAVRAFASAHQGGRGMTTFFCKKCKCQKPINELIVRGNLSICASDVNSYKNITDRWKSNPALRVWWKAQGDDGQAAWFKKQHTLDRGQKRHFDDVTYVENHSEEARRNRMEDDRYIPWWMFLRDGLVMGKSEAALRQEFSDTVNNPDIHCEFARGQWLIPRFEGLLVQSGSSVVDSSSSWRSAAVQSQSQLQGLVQTGRTLVQQQLQQNSHSAAMLTPRLMLDMPTVHSRIEDQPQRPHITDLLQASVLREVPMKHATTCEHAKLMATCGADGHPKCAHVWTSQVHRPLFSDGHPKCVAPYITHCVL
jgi:hypothetical protein